MRKVKKSLENTSVFKGSFYCTLFRLLEIFFIFVFYLQKQLFVYLLVLIIISLPILIFLVFFYIVGRADTRQASELIGKIADAFKPTFECDVCYVIKAGAQ